LHYGNSGTGYREYEVDVDSECIEDRNKYKCNSLVDLFIYNNQEIEYWYTIEDFSGEVDDSRSREVDVDVVLPVIEDVEFEVDGTRVEFVINITELNFDEVEYYDHDASRPKWRRMCSRLDEGICEDRITLRDPGNHEIEIRAIDDAGNSVSESVIVEII